MSDFTSFEQSIDCLKMRSLPAIDVRKQVMERIYKRSGSVQKRPQRRFIISAAALIAVMAAIPVSATVLPFAWKGMEFSIAPDDGGRNNRIEAFKELIAGHENAIQWLERGMKVSENLSSDEATHLFPFAVLRPASPVMPLRRSIGLKAPVTVNGVKSTDQFTYSYWDEYHNGNQWVVVRQMLNEPATDFMNHQSGGYSSTYEHGYQSIQLKGDTIGFIAKESHHEYLMYADYWNGDEKKVIELQISGNVPQEILAQVANSYIKK